MPKLYLSALVLGCSLLLLSGCGPARLGSSNEPTPTPTWEPVATFTPTPLPIATATDMPTTAPADPSPPVVAEALAVTSPLTATETVTTVAAVEGDLATVELLPTATPEPPPPDAAPATAAQLTILVDAANVRNGPGTDYSQIGVAMRDAQYPVVGRNEQGDWWQACCFDDQPGWLFGTLVEVQNPELVAVIVDVPPPPVPATVEPVAEVVPDEAPAVAEPAPAETEAGSPGEDAPADPAPAEAPPVAVGPGEHSGTAGNLDPDAQYQIVHYRVLGFEDNNGGIFNRGGQHHIFLTVLDQNGNGVDGAVVKDAVGDKLNVVTGNKGPGKAEIEMYWDPYKLYVATDPSGAVTSQVSNQMNTAYPHIPDVVGMLGPVDNEYAICPTVDDRCSPPFYHAHWSYEITFQKVR